MRRAPTLLLTVLWLSALACRGATSETGDGGAPPTADGGLSSDPRCSPENCAALAQCAVSLPGQGENAPCYAAADGGLTDAQVAQLASADCARVCNVSLAGGVLACIAQQFGAACADAGPNHPSLATISAACSSQFGNMAGGPGPFPSDGGRLCLAACDAADTACVQSCLGANLPACLGCADTCLLTQTFCRDHCGN